MKLEQDFLGGTMTKDELQTFLKLAEEIKSGNKEFIEEQNKWLSKIGQMERNLELFRDLKHFLDISSSRELNSFEKGIKEECERLLNNLDKSETMINS